MESARSKSFSAPPHDTGIFERSLSFSMSSLPPTSRQKLARTLSNRSQHSNSSYSIPFHHNTEDYIAPVLDTTTEILTNPSLDLDNVNIVCCCEDDEDIDQETDRDSDDATNQSKSSLTQNIASHNHSHPKKIRSRSRSRSSICKSLMNSMSPNSQQSQHQLPQSASHTNIGPSSPLFRSSKSNISLSNNHFQQSSQSQQQSASPDCKTINFYSFADMLDNERVEHEQEDNSIIEESNPSPPQFRGFSFSEPAHHEIDDSLHKRTNSSHSPPSSADGFTTLSVKEYISKLT